MSERELVECQRCDGAGETIEPGRLPEDFEGEPTMADFEPERLPCSRCGGRGLEYDGLGCPQCGAGESVLSSSLMPYDAYRQSCRECGWWEVVG